jgi:protein NrfC
LDNKPPQKEKSLNQSISRRRFFRSFITASTSVAVFGGVAYTLWKTGIDIWENSSYNLSIPISNGFIIFDPALCTGCQTCEIICTTYHDKGSNLAFSRIQLLRDPFEGDFDNFLPFPCLQCENPSCIHVCPVTALKIDNISGTNARIIDETECIGCKRCIEECEAKNKVSRIRFDEVHNRSIKCHLCHGDPMCVLQCPNGALRFVTELDPDMIEGDNINQAIFQEERSKDIPRRN